MKTVPRRCAGVQPSLRGLLSAWYPAPPVFRMLTPWVLPLVLMVAGLLYAIGALFRLPAMLIAMFIAVWCLLFFVSAVLQNSAANAALVPRLRRRLQRNCFIAGALGALLIAMVLAPAFGTRHFSAMLVCAGALMCVLLLLRLHAWLVLVAPPLVFTWYIAHRLIDGHRDNSLVVGLVWTGAAVALELAALAWSVRLALPPASNRQVPRPANGTGLLARVTRALHAAVLRRDIGNDDQAALMLHAMGAGQHVGVSMLLALVPTGLVLGAMVSGLVDHDLMAETATATSVIQFLFWAPMLYVSYVLKALRRSSVEQSLFRLTARAPHARELNRVWAGIVLCRFLLVWTVSVACLVALAVVSEHGWPANGMRAMQAALWLLSALPLLCNHASAPKSRGGSASIVILAPMSMMFLYYVVPWFDGKLRDFNWWWPTLALIIVLAATMRWQWVRLMAAPTVYPAGRIAC